MPNNNETSLQVNNSNEQTLTRRDADKAIKAIQLRIRLLKKELEEMQTMFVNLNERFESFCNQYFRHKDVALFTMRDFRKSFHTYMKNIRTFTVNELQSMLENYCREEDFFLYPTYHNKKEYQCSKYIYIKGEGDAHATIVIRKDTRAGRRILKEFAKEAQTIKEEDNHE